MNGEEGTEVPAETRTHQGESDRPAHVGLEVSPQVHGPGVAYGRAAAAAMTRATIIREKDIFFTNNLSAGTETRITPVYNPRKAKSLSEGRNQGRWRRGQVPQPGLLC